MPGALLRNRDLRFLGRDVLVTPERLDTPFTRSLAQRTAAAHADRPRRGLLLRRRARPSTSSSAAGQVLFRYATVDGGRADEDDGRANPNGSLHAIAGVLNAAGNVAGLMPHPERAAERLLGNDDGLAISALAGRVGGRARRGRWSGPRRAPRAMIAPVVARPSASRSIDGWA